MDLYTFIHEIQDYEILAIAALCVTFRYVSPDTPLNYEALLQSTNRIENLKKVYSTKMPLAYS